MQPQDSKIKLYIISGLGANARVFDKITFNEDIDPVFIDWLMPERDENFDHYIFRMAEKIDDTKAFYLLGYSFGGVLVQEIHKLKPAKKIVILGSIKSCHEKSKFFNWNQLLRLYKVVPMSVFSNKKAISYAFFRKANDKRIDKLYEYFTVRQPYYLKWCIHQILNWKGEEQKEVVQILADKDVVFPVKNSAPDYVIKGASHLFPVTRAKEVSDILRKVLS
ncbi:alpha/beta hydrolase [Elizabethkingia ursingii]